MKQTVKQTVKSSSAEPQSHSHPAKEEHHDSKSAKLSERSEEKRAKLREIEVSLLFTHWVLSGVGSCLEFNHTSVHSSK